MVIDHLQLAIWHIYKMSQSFEKRHPNYKLLEIGVTEYWKMVESAADAFLAENSEIVVREMDLKPQC